MTTSLGGPFQVAQPLLQRGRLLMQLHRGQMGGQLPLLDLEEAIRRPSGGPMGQLGCSSKVLDLPVGMLDATMGLLHGR